MKRIGLVSAAFAAMLTVACGGDRDRDVNNPANDTPAVGAGDAGTAGARGTAGESREVERGAQDWVRDRLIGGMAEVKLGELAEQKARNAEVKAFGKQMVQDHTKAGDELKQIAAQHNIQPPADLDDDHRDQLERLSKLQGAEFDREYLDVMVDNHEKTLEALEDRVEKEGTDENPIYTPKQDDNQVNAALNQWAAKTAPTVHQHLQKARQLNEKLGRRMTNE